MKVKVLFEARFKIVGVMNGEECLAEDFLFDGEDNTLGQRGVLTKNLDHLAEVGPQDVPPGWIRLVNKPHKIFEFKKGPLRLFFFNGVGNTFAVCTYGERKTTKKVDKSAVAAAIDAKVRYWNAVNTETLEEI